MGVDVARLAQGDQVGRLVGITLVLEQADGDLVVNVQRRRVRATLFARAVCAAKDGLARRGPPAAVSDTADRASRVRRLDLRLVPAGEHRNARERFDVCGAAGDAEDEAGAEVLARWQRMAMGGQP